MHHPVGALAAGHQRIQRPGGRPHQVAAGLVVLRISVGDPAGVEDRPHQSLADIVAHIVVFAGEILLTDVVEDVIDAGNHLIARQRQGVSGVQDGEFGHDPLVCKDMSDLLLRLLVGDDGAGVHLRAGPHHGQHAAHRQRLTGGFLKTQIIFLPGVFLTVDRDGYRLGIVADRTAAHRQKQIRMVTAGDLDALIQLGKGGVGHDAGDLCHILAALLQDPGHFLIDAVFLDGAAAVDQHDIRPVLVQLFGKEAQRIIAEIQLGRIAVRKIA